METMSIAVDGSASDIAERRSWEKIPIPHGLGG
jgi:hypothetical protein